MSLLAIVTFFYRYIIQLFPNYTLYPLPTPWGVFEVSAGWGTGAGPCFTARILWPLNGQWIGLWQKLQETLVLNPQIKRFLRNFPRNNSGKWGIRWSTTGIEKMFLTRLDKPTDRSSPSAHDQCLTSRVSCTIQVNLLSQSRQLPNPSPKPHFLQGEWMTCWRFPDHIRYPSQVWLSRWFSWRRMVPTSGESAKRHRDVHLATASRGNDHRFFNPCDVGCPREIETLYSTHTHIYKYIHTH